MKPAGGSFAVAGYITGYCAEAGLDFCAAGVFWAV